MVYLEAQYPRDFYLITHNERRFSEIIQKSYEGKVAESEIETELKVKKIGKELSDMINNRILDNDFKMYFYSFPKGSYVKNIDEKQICDAIAKSLYDAGYEVDTCYDGEEALECILTENYDLVVLDLNLPGMDGMEILKELRQSNEETKVLILSARGQIADKVEGLDAGANDYMEKPFHLQELEARIRSLTRRKFVQKDVCLESGDIKFDTIKREAYAKEIKISLTRKEKGILEYLLLNLGRPVSQEELMEHVWDASVDSFSGAIRVHMSSLRRKLKAVLGHDVIMNKVGEGYKIREESDR